MPATTKPNTSLDALLVFFASYFVYLLTLFPTVGPEDSGELITSAATLDIAHPPGYPLHTLLGKLFTIIVPFGNIGWRVNLMSAFFAAATVMLLFLVVKKITSNSAIAMVTSLFFAFSDIFWSQAIRTETYTLHTFLFILVIYLLTCWDEHQQRKYLLLGALVVGLGLANQHLLFLAGIPIIAYVLIKNWRAALRPTTILAGLLLFALGLSAYAYLPLRTLSGPYKNPAYIKHEALHDWDNFFHFVNRGIYGGTVNVTPGEESTETTATVLTPVYNFFEDLVVNNVNGFLPFFAKLFEQTFFLSFLLFIPGLWYLFTKKRGLFWLISLLLLFYSVVQLKFIGYAWEMHPFTLHATRPFLLSAIVVLAIITGTGLAFCIEAVRRKQLQKQILIVLLFLPVIPLLVNFQNNNESGNYIAYDINRHLLESLPPNAHFITTGRDNFTFPLYYLQQVEHVRPDVTLDVYYSRKSITQDFLEQTAAEHGRDRLYLDLLPHQYNELTIWPYNFVYEFRTDDERSTTSRISYPVRGIRPDMDYQNNKLIGLYYLKMAIIHHKDSAATEQYFRKVRNELPYFLQFDQFINDYRGGSFSTGMF